MAEIVGIFLLARMTGRLAVSKGYSKWYGWAYVPLAWLAAEFFVMAILLTAWPDLNIYLVMGCGVAGGIVGGTRVYFSMKRRAPRLLADGAPVVPDPPVSPRQTPTTPGVSTAQASEPKVQPQARSGKQVLSGFCEECGANVTLTPDGGCRNGHGPDSVSGSFWALKE